MICLVEMEDVNTCIDRKSKVNRLGWIVTAASFAANLVTDGIFYSFGLFLSEIVLYFDEPVAKVSWVFSILNGISMLTGKFY